jgi:hypothetical protein
MSSNLALKRLFTGAFLCALPALALAQSFEFKGIVVGTRIPTAAIEKNLGITCRAAEGNQACSGNSTMMSLPAKVYIDILAGAVARIDVSYAPLLFTEAAKSLNQRYGPPFRTNTAMHTWRNKRGDLVILQRDGLLSFSSAEEQRKTDQTVREMKKDF